MTVGMTPENAGQIVRINLENFMSYDNIEIHPGRHLNLIIGPNGTGKSTIVCAVLLCLGGKMKTLSRADHLGSYVKTGCDQSCIEVELFNPGDHNIIIKRKIMSNNHSEFIINGKVSTISKVNDIKKKFNIQIDNLCTFLPQDKVQDFAKLNPQQLLDHTQKTVGTGELVQLHETLKELNSKTLNQEKHCEVLKIELEKEVQKNDRIKEQVKSFKEKQSLCEKIKLLNQKLSWVNYNTEVENKKEIDRDAKLAEDIFKAKKKEVEKCNRELAQFDVNLKLHEKQVTEAKKNEAGKEAAMKDRLRRAEQRVDQLEDIKSTLKTRLEEENEKKEQMLKYKENVEKLTNDLRNLDSTIGSEENYDKILKEIETQFKQSHAEDIRLNDAKLELEESEDSLKQELRRVTMECQNLKQRQTARLDYIRTNEPDVYKSIEWLEQHRHLFQSKIYNPLLLELDVPNTKMAKFVEARIGYKDLISFCCTNADDLNLLVQKLRNEQKLKINVICSDECDSTQYISEIPISDLRCYGFYAYMKDFITGPDDIIRFLCKTYKIHTIPIGDETVKANCAKVPQNIPLFYSDNYVFTVKYSVYSGDKSINVKKLAGTRFFGESLNEERIEHLIKRGKELESAIKKKQLEISGVDSEISKLRVELEKIKKRRKEVATGAQERQMIQMSLTRASNKYQSVKVTLRNPKDIEDEAKEQEQILKKEIQRNLTDLSQVSEAYEKATLVRQKCELKYKVEKLGKAKLLQNKEQCMDEMSNKETLFREIKERQRAAEYKCSQLKDKAKQLTDNISIEEKAFKRFREIFSTLPNTLEELETEIDVMQTKTEFLQAGNLQILQEYERREEKITELKSNLAENMRNLEQKQLELNRKRTEWLTPVNSLISSINDKFGRYFEAMGCAGEVSLTTGDTQVDFDKYGIKIKVKFRDGTPLEELGRQFQSGGERAVSTAIFMLSLQELTSVPFRFVDEINQGMDPTNEKRILQIIINVTSRNQASQYFFITPKLLPDVDCSRTMTVLCIHNGPNAIPSDQWNMRKLLGEDESDEGEE
ncbi:hypothetical protein RUM44_011403 [Polyplax serrata]|uniref:Structural maintenance of chromosomes protein 5 n=1 Tax=Polyplax serrata TaxID=468196 RepID=A0ABR1ARF3_POLSC